MNLYRLPHPALFLLRADKEKRPQIRVAYANALTRLATSKGSQAVHRARRQERERLIDSAMEAVLGFKQEAT